MKFLKSLATEAGHVANVVSQYALAYPEVAFSFTVDGKETLKTSGKGKLLDAVIDVYGASLAGKMLPVVAEDEVWQGGITPPEIKVTGMVGAPDLGRASRDLLSFFVNRRWITNRLLSYAVEEAYSGLLMTGRHPVAVLDIRLPPGEVDVNIHPAKSEVKFRSDAAVFRAVQRTVRRTLVAQMPVPGIEEVVAPYRAAPQPMPQLWETSEVPQTSLTESSPRLMTSLPVLRVVGQVMNRYILAEGPDGLYLIDQHAAHERIRYDRLKQQRETRQPEVQGLLEPATLEVTPRQDAIMQVVPGQTWPISVSL